MHTLGKIDRIQYFHFISMPYQHLSALNDDRSLGVRDHITDIFSHLHQIWFYIKPGLSGTRSANYNHVLVPCKFRILGSAVHSQPFGHGKENIVLKYWVDKGCNVFCCPPSSRTILHHLKIQKQHHQPFHRWISLTILIQPCFFVYQIKDYDIRSIQCQYPQGISFQIFP